MKKVIFAFLITFIGFLSFTACEKAPEITLSSPGSIEVSAQGGSSIITFTTNTDWTVRSSDSWVSVSPSSGTVTEDGIVTIKVSCTANTTYEDRSAVVTISAEDITQTVTVHQPANLGIIVPKKLYEITGEATIEVEVQSNVQYKVSISDDWITQTGTKGLVTDKLMFEVKDNDTYDTRSAFIVITALEGNVPEEVVAVKQAQKDAIVIDKASYEMPYGGGEIQVNVKANVGFDVKPDVDWIHYVETKALSTSTVCLAIDENKTYSPREGKVLISQRNGSLSYEITVKQAGRIAVTSVSLNKTEITLEIGASETLIATVTPENATDKSVSWSSSNTSIAVVENGRVTGVSPGTATIAASAGGKQASCTVTVNSGPADAVDLGLSVKWASYNMGASSPEEYGDYYAWGETSTKNDYSLSTYKFRTSGDKWDNVKFSKYNTSSAYGPVDNKTTLELSDDAAHVNWGGSWRMPTDAEWTELWTKCTWTWTTQNGIKGYKVTSKTNGNSIFFPAAGYRDGTSLYGVGSHGDYWSSSLNTYRPYLAWGVLFYSEEVVRSGGGLRSYGESVRPVYGDYVDGVPVASVSLNKTSLSLTAGSCETLVATVSPTNATNKTVTWSSSNTSVATVSSSGVVTAKALGTATITASAGGKTASCTVTVTQPSSGPEAVDLGLSVKWASYNLGASSPEDYGDYYAWGETAPKSNYSWSTYKWCNGSSTTLTKYRGRVDNKTTLELSDDAARANWGGSWRMPTYAEWTELRTQCTWTWTTQNGIKGYKVTSKMNWHSIFLPAAGYRYDTTLDTAGSYGFYWSSSLYSDGPYGAWVEYFYSGEVGRRISERCCGNSVRPVCDYVDGVPVASVSLNKTSLSLTAGSSETLVATVSPSNATNKTVWSSSNTAVATVSSGGWVTAHSVGSATITASAGGKTATCTVTVTQPSSGPEAVDLGLSVKWASYNLGASSPEEYGDYYAWGETAPKSYYRWSTYKWCNGSIYTQTKYNTNSSYGVKDKKTRLERSDDAARVNWGGSWRMPTDAEWTELRTQCTWTWTTQNGIKGYKVISETNGHSIFLPAAGYRDNAALYSSSSYYWSSSLNTDYPYDAWGVRFGPGELRRLSSYRFLGQSVRPVSE